MMKSRKILVEIEVEDRAAIPDAAQVSKAVLGLIDPKVYGTVRVYEPDEEMTEREEYQDWELRDMRQRNE